MKTLKTTLVHHKIMNIGQLKTNKSYLKVLPKFTCKILSSSISPFYNNQVFQVTMVVHHPYMLHLSPLEL